MARLRTGFTTGTYAAATTLAAWRCLRGRRLGGTIGVWFPDGKQRRVNLDGARRAGGGGEAWARKDAGDDVDVTDGAVIRSRLRPVDACEIRSEDHREPCGRAVLVLRGGSGVGLCTRAGLDVASGKWAINPVPRRMVADNLAHAGLDGAGPLWLAEIGIDRGEELARRTLNPTLGVVDGLSVLGTSGIVVPCSNAAYISTIRVLLRGARQAGSDTAVLVTGGRTQRAAQALYPEFPDVAFVRIGDFIKEACESAREYGLRRIVVCCMPGKLAKYALGHAYTHAHRVSLSVPHVVAFLGRQGVPVADASAASARSMRECFDRMADPLRGRALQALVEGAERALRSWVPGVELAVRVLSFDGTEWWS
jgi:cobalt-precorrin-5B (C1)-methyltransferase